MEIWTATQEEFRTAVEWAAAEGWNPGLNDTECYFAADPEGFFLGRVDGVVMAGISAVRYEGGFGFIGFFIVKKEYRGRGFGKQMWAHAMGRLGDCHNTGLDGVPEQQENYRRSGFYHAYENIRHELRVDTSGTGMERSSDKAGPVPRPLSDWNLNDVLSYDSQFFPASRTAFQRKWFTQTGGTGCATGDNQGITGLGYLRPCRSGMKIGPLQADSPGIAEAILDFLLEEAKKMNATAVYLDIPRVNPHALDMVRNYGMIPVFETARMYTSMIPPIQNRRLYGVTSFEIG
jgi:ribosomal protein S18 acetylase RimI-like enzyme